MHTADAEEMLKRTRSAPKDRSEERIQGFSGKIPKRSCTPEPALRNASVATQMNNPLNEVELTTKTTEFNRNDTGNRRKIRTRHLSLEMEEEDGITLKTLLSGSDSTSSTVLTSTMVVRPTPPTNVNVAEVLTKSNPSMKSPGWPLPPKPPRSATLPISTLPSMVPKVVGKGGTDVISVTSPKVPPKPLPPVPVTGKHVRTPSRKEQNGKILHLNDLSRERGQSQLSPVLTRKEAKNIFEKEIPKNGPSG